MTEWISSVNEGGILQVRIERPNRKNALTRAMYSRMAELLEQSNADESVRGILLTGAQECFTAGNDMVDFVQMSTDNETPLADQPVFRFLHALQGCKKPVVAAVCGPAVGIGTTLLLHCDYVVAAPNAVFSTPFVRLGLCSEGAASTLLPLMVGVRVAQAMLMWGKSLDAQEALLHGLVTEVVQVEQADDVALARVKEIASLPSASVTAVKSLMKLDGHVVRKVMADEAQEFARLLAGDAAKEAFASFLEKRMPNFARL